MNSRAAGFVVARGFAVILALQSVGLVLTVVPWAYEAWRSSYPWWATASTLFQPLVFLAVAAALWRGAERFGARSDDGIEPNFDTSSATGVAIVVVALFVIYIHFPGFFNYLWMSLDSKERANFDMRPHFRSDLACVIAAAIVLPFGWRQSFILRGLTSSEEQE